MSLILHYNTSQSYFRSGRQFQAAMKFFKFMSRYTNGQPEIVLGSLDNCVMSWKHATMSNETDKVLSNPVMGLQISVCITQKIYNVSISLPKWNMNCFRCPEQVEKK